jgi:hypothetical protein
MEIDWRFWAPMIATALQLAVGIYQSRLQIRQMKLALAPAKVQEVNAMPWFKTYWPMVAMLVAMVGSWIPYFVVNRPPETALTAWGPNGQVGAKWPMPGIPPQLTATLNGRSVISRRATHHVAVVAFHSFGTTDVEDVRDLQKSSLFEIRDDYIKIVFPVNDTFMAEVAKGYEGTAYTALLVPNGVRMGDFQSLREAHKLGVTDIGGGIGPP